MTTRFKDSSRRRRPARPRCLPGGGRRDRDRSPGRLLRHGRFELRQRRLRLERRRDVRRGRPLHVLARRVRLRGGAHVLEGRRARLRRHRELPRPEARLSPVRQDHPGLRAGGLPVPKRRTRSSPTRRPASRSPRTRRRARSPARPSTPTSRRPASSARSGSRSAGGTSASGPKGATPRCRALWASAESRRSTARTTSAAATSSAS